MPGVAFSSLGNFRPRGASKPVYHLTETSMRSTILVSLLCVLSSPAFANDLARPATPEKPHIDVVFCLDCSGSMGPVIETAKQKVWSIVNEIARAKPTPILRIGLLGYGNFDKQYRQFDLSDDLDIVYKN